MNNTQHLLKLALDARENAYAPYSKFKVGAAVLSSNGNFYTGCNVENIAFPESVCAETGAISQMVAGGDKLIKEILIIADADISPCGGCLQRIKEFSDENTLVHMANLNGIHKTLRIKEMLPIAFGEGLCL